MSHTSASWAQPLELEGPHPTVILLFTCVHGLQASKSQKMEGRAPALEEKMANRTILFVDCWKSHMLRLFRPKG